MKLKQRGALIVEYVLILPSMLLMIFLVVYFGMAFHDYNALNTASREAARYGVVGNNYAAVKTNTLARCNELLTALYKVEESDITIDSGKDGALADEKFLDVRITATKDSSQSMILIDEFLPDKLSAHTRMRIEVEPKADASKPETKP